ncbi:hypothetical protein [Lacrimispora sp.]|uniref:hypothetical protein n=1 Tax=Lacrimispora sp. TaxID=2719234 RepID=UPI002867AC55|nr:hypothetical protein [Lacrimispora sp.]MDR7811129.1 hypothetical protein [Lacrimispora sp.]
MRNKISAIFILVAMFMVLVTGCKKTEGGGNMPEALKGDLTSIIGTIYEKAKVDLSLGNTPIDLTNKDMVKYNMGLDDASKVKEAVVSEAMIGSQAYSLVLARVNNAADAEAVAKDMLNGIDQRKWICVMADDLQIVTYNDLIMLVMVDSNLKDAVTSQQVADAFKEMCGTDFDLKLSK